MMGRVLVRLKGRGYIAFILAVGLLLAWTARPPDPNGWDEAFYVSQLTSLAGDGDLLLHDDLLAFENRDLSMRLRTVAETNPVIPGALNNNFGIGATLIHGFYLWPVLRDHAGWLRCLPDIYALGSIALFVLTVLATHALLIELDFSESMASWCALAACFLGPLALYGTRLQFVSHLPSAFCAALASYFAWRWHREGGLPLALLSGIFIGLTSIVRWQDVLFPVALLPFVLHSLLSTRRDQRGRRIAEISVAVLMMILVGIIQLIALQKQNGTIFGIPQGSDYVSFGAPKLAPFLLSPLHGLLPWMPGFALGLAGLAFAAWRERLSDRRWFLGCLVAFAALEIYVSSTPADWWAGSSYGSRRLAALTPFAAIGLAAIARSIALPARAIGGAALIGWAMVTTSLYVRHVDDLSVIFFGATSEGNVLPLSAYPSAAGLGPRGFVGFLTGSFTLPGFFSSSLVAHAAGVCACLLVCAVAALLWRPLVETRRGRMALAGCGTGWVLLCLAVIATVPSNRDANSAWVTMDRRANPDHALSQLKPETAAAGHVLAAWRAIRSGDLDAARRHMSLANSNQFPPVGLSELSLLDEATARRGGP
jgi:hypothetical protein